MQPDFWLYHWQIDEEGNWRDSYRQIRDLPPAEQHRRDWCYCPLCRPDRYPDLDKV